MASDYTAARQTYVDFINAGVSIGIPFLQKHVNIGKKFINEENRTGGELHVSFPAGGTGGVEQLVNASGPVSGALDRTSFQSGGKGAASYFKDTFYPRNSYEFLEHTSMQKLFQMGNIKKNVVTPRINHLCQMTEKDLVDRNWTRAAGCTVTSTIGFGILGKAMSYIETVKSAGSWTGFMSPLLQSLISDTTLSKASGFDVPDNILREMYGKYALGYCQGAEWVKEPFMPVYQSGALNTTDTASGVTVKADVTTQGANEIVVTGFTAAGTVKKGTPFTIEGVYDVSTTGIKMDWLKVFIVQEDASSAADSDKYKYTLKVLPMYFNDDTKGYCNNLYNASSKIPATAVVKGLCAASSTYYTAFIKEDEAFNFTPFELDEVEGCTNTTTSTDDLTVQLCSGGSLLTHKNAMRIDCPYWGDIVDPRACRLVMVKV